MKVLKNNWSDAARAASLASRRANAAARAAEAARAAIEVNEGPLPYAMYAQQEFGPEPGVSRQPRFIKTPRNTKTDNLSELAWDQHGNLYTDQGLHEYLERRKKEDGFVDNLVGLALRFQGPAMYFGYEGIKYLVDKIDELSEPRKVSEPFIENWIPRGADGATVPSRYDEETGELIPLPYDEWPEHLKNDPYRGLREGDVIDPHYGGWDTKTAPYGYNDVTGEPRAEPLYTTDGIPIVPRLPIFDQAKMHFGWEQGIVDDHHLRTEQALFEWGKFGQKKEWMEANPGKDWRDYKKHMEETYGDDAIAHAPEIQINKHNLWRDKLSTPARQVEDGKALDWQDLPYEYAQSLSSAVSDVMEAPPGFNVDRDILDDIVRTITGSSQGIPTPKDIDDFVKKEADFIVREVLQHANTIDDIYQTIFGTSATDIGESIRDIYDPREPLDPQSKLFTIRYILRDLLTGPRWDGKGTYTILPSPEIRAAQAAARAKAARRAELENTP
jgi:hypothetical protein